MPDATITSTASTFGTITGTFAADQSTITGTVTGVVVGTLDGSVGVPGIGVPDGGTTGQVLKKASNTSYDTVWGTDLASAAWGTITGTLSSQTDLQTALDAKAPLASPAFTGNPTAPTAALADNDTSIATTAFVQQELASGVAVAKNLEVYVRNQTGSTLTAGTIVYINGATGNRPTVTKAQANNDANSAQTFGFVKTSIANNGFGYVIVRGECENLDTSALTEGAQLYLSPTTAGTWTTTKPSAPQHLVYVGIVVRAHPTQGVILVAIQNGYELNEIHDVLIDTPSNGQVLKYDAAQGLWINGTDSSGVAWGGITGTLSSQTDLQTALDAKLPKSGGYITGDIQSSNNSAYRSWDGTYKTSVLKGDYLQLSSSGPGGNALTIEWDGITFPSGKQTVHYPGTGILSGYATESWVTSGFYPLTGNPSGFITSAALSPYLTSATAASTYQTIAGMSSYLTTSAAASTYAPLASPTFTGTVTIPAGASISGYATTASLSSYAPLASPALTGTPTSTTAAADTNTTQIATTAYVVGQASSTSPVMDGSATVGTSLKYARADHVHPTDTSLAPLASPALTGTPTAPTASVGTNTTQIATTAFVLANAGSTTFATNAQAIVGTSTNTALAPSIIGAIVSHPELRPLNYFTQTSVSGSGAVTTGSINYGQREMYLSSLAVGRACWSYGIPGANANNMSRADWRVLNFSKKIWMSGKAMCYSTTGFGTSYPGDANTYTRITLGGYNSAATGDMTMKGIGWKKQGGSTPYITLTVHNGTTLTDVATTVAPANNESVDWIIYSDGTGNVTLYINGTQAATTSAGPTGTTSNYANAYREQTEAATTPGARSILECTGGYLYIEG